MILATSKSTFNQGQDVIGIYCGKHFTGKLNEFCRPTPDYENMIFAITLDYPIEVYGEKREAIEIWTNDSNTLYLD